MEVQCWPRNRGFIIAGVGAIILTILFMMIGLGPLAKSAPAAAKGAGNGTPAKPFVGAANPPNTPVVLGQVHNWQGLVHLVDRQHLDWYKLCFASLTHHPWSDAETAAAREHDGWNEQVTLVSNTTQAAATNMMQSIGQNPDPDFVFKNGFENTKGLPNGGCVPFFDSRSQGRLALTLPGPDKHTPGTPVVLEFCGNILPQPQPAAPKTPSRPSTPGTPSVPSVPSVPPSTPPTTVRPPKCPPTGPCEQRNVNQLPATNFRPFPGDSAGATQGGSNSTQQQQAPSDTPNQQTGSQPGPNTPVPVFNPPTAPPDSGTVPAGSDPCNGLPPGSPGSNC